MLHFKSMQCLYATHILDLSIILAYKIVASVYTAQKLILTVTLLCLNIKLHIYDQICYSVTVLSKTPKFQCLLYTLLVYFQLLLTFYSQFQSVNLTYCFFTYYPHFILLELLYWLVYWPWTIIPEHWIQ